jgi:transcriptional regulator with XRE-family HTH domain
MTRKNDYIDQIDKHIGGKIHSLRITQGLSRLQLSKVVGVTTQQLQKYEKGTNRLSAGRLVLVAKALAKDVSYFYEGLDNNEDARLVTKHQRMCIEVSRNFMKIKSSDHQTAVNTLVKSLSKVA